MAEHFVSVEGDHWTGWSWVCDCGTSASGFDGDGDAWHAGQEHERATDRKGVRSPREVSVPVTSRPDLTPDQKTN